QWALDDLVAELLDSLDERPGLGTRARDDHLHGRIAARGDPIPIPHPPTGNEHGSATTRPRPCRKGANFVTPAPPRRRAPRPARRGRRRFAARPTVRPRPPRARSASPRRDAPPSARGT